MVGHWSGWLDGVAVVSILDDLVDRVQSSKKTPNVLRRPHSHVSETVQDEFVIGFRREFLLEVRTNDGPLFPVTLNVLKSDL